MKVLVWKRDDTEVLLDTGPCEVVVRVLKTHPDEDQMIRFPIQDLLDKYVKFCRPGGHTKR